jgi:hypothetical protein
MATPTGSSELKKNEAARFAAATVTMMKVRTIRKA